VVLVKEDHGWYAFFCTDPNASVQDILEAFADRATIEQDFHDVKEVWGSGQQQVVVCQVKRNRGYEIVVGKTIAGRFQWGWKNETSPWERSPSDGKSSYDGRA